MSVEICSLSETNESHGGPQSTTVGGSKPLHRFLKGQPKIIGTVVLILGTSLFIVTIATMADLHTMNIWPALPVTLVLAAKFIASGILYIVTDHNPTKKTVTTSLALSIFSILGVAWTILRTLPQIGRYYSYRYRNEMYYEYNITTEIDVPTATETSEDMVTAFETITVFHTFVAGIIFIVMSALAGAALRSTKSQAILMTTTLTETPIE